MRSPPLTGLLLFLTVGRAVAAGVPATRPAASPAVRETLARLDKILPEIRFDAVALGDVLNFLKDTTGLAFDVDWPALAKAGVAKDAPVSARLRDVKVDKVLQVVLKSAVRPDARPSPEDVPSTAVGPDGRVRVTTRRELFARFAVVKTYPLADLVRDPNPAGRDAIVRQVVRLITDTVASGTWASRPGEAGGTVAVDGDTLRVTQTDDAHVRIAELLATIRGPAPTTAP